MCTSWDVHRRSDGLGLPRKISTNQKNMRLIRAHTLPTYEGATYANCRNVYQRTLSDEVRAKLAEEVSKTIVIMSGGMAICEF